MSLTLYLVLLYLAFGVGWSWRSTMKACHESSHLGTPGAVGLAGVITLVLISAFWPYWGWKWRYRRNP
jgi:hypothetical protein